MSPSQLVDGTHYSLPEGADRRAELQQRLQALYSAWGYRIEPTEALARCKGEPA